MTRHILWQALLALLGIVLVFVFLFRLASSEVPPVATIELPVQGGTYIEGVLGYAEKVNPILTPKMVQANPFEQDLGALVFDGLTTLDATGQITPALALDWDVSEDGSVYEFHLRPDVAWHDGAPFTSEDVAFTIQALQDPGYQGPAALRELWRNVTVEKLDSLTVRLTLEEPLASFLYYTTIGLLPSHLLSNVPAVELPSYEFSTQNPVGTGRFRVASIAPDQVTLIANANYWGGESYLAQIEFWLFGNREDLLASYDAGEIHGFHLEKSQGITELARFSNLRFYSAPSPGFGMVLVNLARETVPFFQDKQVRQALLYGLDRQTLISDVLGGQGLVADSAILPYVWAHDPGVRQYIYDPERAIGLLDASGWMDSDADLVRDKDAVEMAFTLLTSDDPVELAMAERISSQWEAIGVDVTLLSVSGGSVANLVRDRDFDAALIKVGLTGDPDPYSMWHSTQTTESGQNFAGFASEEADVVLEEARTTSDPERLTELYYRFQQIFAEEVPALLLYYPIYNYAVDAQVHEVQISPLLHSSDRFRNVEDWYVETEEFQVNDEVALDKNGD